MDIITLSYAPWQDATYGGSSCRPLLNTPTFSEREHFVVKVQPFRAGGYEATCRLVDVQDASDLAAMPRKFGPREDTGTRSLDSLLRARQRAKQTVRLRIKDMGGNRLCTLTIRQTDDLGYLSPDEWAISFARFVRLLRKAGLLNDYVAILEPHKKGLDRLNAGEVYASDGAWNIPLHLHFVTRSVMKMPINLMRKCWAVASRRSGNIDVKFLKSRVNDDSAIDRCAAYATKYITKGLGEVERFNKKRYWAAGEKMLDKGRLWMRSRELHTVFEEFRSAMQLSDEIVGELFKKRRLFFFPNGSGFWMNLRPSVLATPPPF